MINLPPQLLQKGINLEFYLSVDILWWKSTDALEIIDIAKKTGQGIFSCDVVEKVDEDFFYNYECLKVDKKINENWEDYILRSCQSAKNFVESLRDKNVFFAFTFIN